jgi:hypothetical protein
MQAMEQSTTRLQTLKEGTQEALERAMHHFVTCAQAIPSPVRAEEEMDTNEGAAGVKFEYPDSTCMQ